MNKEIFFKSFIAALAFPAFILPFIYTFLYFVVGQPLEEYPLQFIPLYVPIIFGITNIIYFWIGDRCPVKEINARLWVTGAILGLIVAIIGVFIIEVPTIVFGFTGNLRYLPIVIIPIVYGAIFRYIIKWLNRLLGLHDQTYPVK